MASISIVVRDADGTTVETCHDSAADKAFAAGGYSGARRAFAAKKFDKNVTLADGHTLVLLVDGVAKLTPPEQKKGQEPGRRRHAARAEARLEKSRDGREAEAERGGLDAARLN